MSDDNTLEIDVGDGLPRRTVMRQIGAASALGALGGLDLPPDAVHVELDGVNHSQFGGYVDQPDGQ